MGYIACHHRRATVLNMWAKMRLISVYHPRASQGQAS